MKTTIIAGVALAASALAWAASDPVLMRVNGEDVTKSEFEYLFNKNSKQQLDPKPLEEYVEMFELYKLKVADAKNAGIDTTASFKAEIAQYAEDLAAPYLTDSTYIYSLVDETANRLGQEAEAIHIMIFKGDGIDSKRRSKFIADSLRTELVNGADRAEMAKKWSKDPNSALTGGNMGFITAGRFPHQFETAVFTTPEGEVAPLVQSPYGYHIVTGGKKRPSRGALLARHILFIATPNMSESEISLARQKADSVCEVLKADPDKFAELAASLSDDKRSGKQGGMLPWFGAGEMLPDFSEAAFALADGQISEPVRTQVGFHIIQRLEQRDIPIDARARHQILGQICSGKEDYQTLLNTHQTARLAKKYKLSLNEPVVNALCKDASVLGVDSLLFEKYSAAPNASLTLVYDGKKAIPVGELIAEMSAQKYSPFDVPEDVMEAGIRSFFRRKVMSAARQRLLQDEPAYRNLLKEYSDGSLLYEISLQRVWDKASRDREGLQQYFDNHREDYTWTSPHVKGYLIQASSDSLAAEMRTALQNIPSDTVIKTFRSKFGTKQGKIERVLVEKGQNAMVDNLIFGTEAVQPGNSAYTTYFLYDAKLLDAPEELDDVRALATNDYQTYLEQEWIEELKNKYPVTVNSKVLKKIKR